MSVRAVRFSTFRFFVLHSFVVTLGLSLAPQLHSQTQDKERARLEELFIWKTSEELKLPPAQEQKFTEIIKDLNSRKRKATAAMDDVIHALANVHSKVDAVKSLEKHRGALREFHAIQLAELDRLQPLLGPEKFSRYLVVKNEISERLKAVLSSAGSTKEAGAPSTKVDATPKIIDAR